MLFDLSSPAPARARTLTAAAGLAAGLLGACTMANPDFDGVADSTGTAGDGDGDGDPSTTAEGGSSSAGTSTTGDGDGDPSTTTTTGDGDGDPSTTTTSGDGDGDGDPNTSGDGDGDGVVCPEGKELCGDQCVDLDSDYANCGECGLSCEGASVCGLGECLQKRYVFVTSEAVLGNFGGREVADSLCNELAMAAQLPGPYAAWLSDLQLNPADGFPGVDAAYILRNGPIVAYSWQDFLDGQHEVPINRTELGELAGPSPVEACALDYGVWTGTTNNGELADPRCGDWLTASAEVFGVIGNAQSSELWSQVDCEAACNLALPLYCVQL